MRVQRVAVLAAQLMPAALAAFYTAATYNSGGPWFGGMVDFGVYHRTGLTVLAGGDIFASTDGLPWVYPPFAALLAVPVAALPVAVSGALWTLGCLLALAAILYRLGFTGWKLSLAALVCVVAVGPVRETIGFGQLGLFLVAAAVLDSLPGPRVFRRRLLPEGVLVGLATAVKLTPAVVAAHNFFAGRRKDGLVAFAAFVAATGLGFLVLPSASVYYWLGLVNGDTGINSGIVYGVNQSVMAALARLTRGPNSLELVAAGLVAVVGVVASVRIERTGRTRLALCIAGLTSLLASPISWSHHFVWIVPLAVVLWQEADLPAWYRWLGLSYVGWVLGAWYESVRRGGDVELTYTWTEQLITNIGPAFGLIFLLSSIFAARTPSAHRGLV